VSAFHLSRPFGEAAAGNGLHITRLRPTSPLAASHEVRHGAGSSTGRSSDLLLLFGHRSPAGLCLGLGLGQEAEARLAPREIDAYIQQRIGTPAWAGKFHDRNNTVGLANSQGHRPARGMVRRGIDAENEIARSDSVAHSFHRLAWEKD